MPGIQNIKTRYGLDKVVDKILHIDDTDTELTIRDQVVRVTSDGAAVTVTLPSVAEAKGLMFDIEALTGATQTVTVEDNSDDAGLSDISLDADNEYVVLWSNGISWREVVTGYS